MRNKLRTIAVLSVLIILLTVSVSFAWMLQVDDSLVKYLLFDYTSENLVVAPQDIEMSLLMQDENGDLGETDDALILTDLVPGNTVKFQIRFKNRSENTVKIMLSMSNVSGELITERTDKNTGILLDMLFLSMRGGTGYIGNNVVVPSLYKRLNIDHSYNWVNDTYSVKLFNSLEIPPTQGDGYVELNCYFYLDEDAGLEYQDKSLTIGTFRAEEL